MSDNTHKLDNEALERVYELHKKYMNKHKELRKGQAFFSALHWVSPSLANKIRNTSADPFYTDDIDLCLQHITETPKTNNHEERTS